MHQSINDTLNATYSIATVYS